MWPLDGSEHKYKGVRWAIAVIHIVIISILGLISDLWIDILKFIIPIAVSSAILTQLIGENRRWVIWYGIALSVFSILIGYAVIIIL